MLQDIDYETVGHALSTCSNEDPYASSSDRSSSPAYSSAPGFQSVPLSPLEWVPPQQSGWAQMQMQSASQYSPPTSSAGYYGLAAQQQQSPSQQSTQSLSSSHSHSHTHSRTWQQSFQ